MVDELLPDLEHAVKPGGRGGEGVGVRGRNAERPPGRPRPARGVDEQPAGASGGGNIGSGCGGAFRGLHLALACRPCRSRLRFDQKRRQTR